MSATRDNTSYAPKSPDLSSLYAGSEAHSSSRLNPYTSPNPTSIPPPTSNPSSYYPLQPPGQAQVQTQLHAQAQAQLETGSHNFNQPQPHYQYQAHQYLNNNNRASNGSAASVIVNNDAYHLPPQQHLPFAAYNHSNPQQPSTPYPLQPSAQFYPLQQHPQYPPPRQPGYHPQPPTSSYYPSHADLSTSTGHPPTSQSPSRHHRPQQQPQPQQSTLVFDQVITPGTRKNMPRGKAAAPVAKEPEIMGSPVRTKFPTARIKRIMQADEEVGKVAQQTPIAVGKALELFMVQLVHKSAEVAKEKNSKRISATMLKQAIDSTNEWDFLRDIVAKVTEEKEGAKSGGRTKADSESEDDIEAGEVKKKGRGGGRKKKATA